MHAFRNVLQRKSTWCISNSIDQQMYGTVESFALYQYKCKGYPRGVHCEGAFPVTLFAILFWDEIYNMNIPGTCVSSYQNAPLDLYSSEFYENRKERIDMKIQIIRTFDSETLSRHLKHEFDLYREYTSLCQGTLFDDSNSFQVNHRQNLIKSNLCICIFSGGSILFRGGRYCWYL